MTRASVFHGVKSIHGVTRAPFVAPRIARGVAIGLALGVALLLGPAVPGAAALPAAVAETPIPSLSPMIKRVSPAVVNIATQGTIKPTQRNANPLLDDPFFRRFFDVPRARSARARSRAPAPA